MLVYMKVMLPVPKNSLVNERWSPYLKRGINLLRKQLEKTESIPTDPRY